MKQTIIYAKCVLALLCGYNTALAQTYFYNNSYYNNPLVLEVGISLGGMNCLTDLGGKKGEGKKFLKDLNWQQTKLCGGVYISLLYKDLVGLRLESSYGQVTACDSVLKGDVSVAGSRYIRNLSFRSTILELTTIIEFHPLYLVTRNQEKGLVLSPYLLAGIGLFNFNPQAKLGNFWINLAQLHTEGQGFAEYPDKKEYKLTQLNLPVGVGLKYELGSTLSLRVEALYRILHTDYLDDVSGRYVDPRSFYRYMNASTATLAEKLADRSRELNPLLRNTEGTIRGNPDNKDAYLSFNVKLGVVINRTRR